MIKGFACFNPKETLHDFTYNPPVLGDAEVEVRVTHCGMCHSDAHLIDNDWGISRYPFIPGHEIIGTVAAVGKNVHDLAIGTRVGIGWQADSCGTCEYCRKGEENHCAKAQPTCVGRHGGYAEAVRANHRFVFPIPDGLESAQAAPLLCGGITVYTPLHEHHIGAGTSIGVVGIGGLGHLALQFAHARGATVTAISSNPQKEAEARSFGAAQFLLSNDAAALEKAASSLDFILITASADIDIIAMLSLLKPHGKICVVGALPKPMAIPAGLLIHGAKSVVGSNIGSPATIRAMLDDAARYKIAAQIETLPLAEVNNGLDKMRAGQARYRLVLVCKDCA